MNPGHNPGFVFARPPMGETLATLIEATAFVGPVIGVGWLGAVILRRSSVKELMALTAFWGLLVLAWIKLFGIWASV